MGAAFARRLSPQTRHFRFFAGVKELTPKKLEAFCGVDGRHCMAFIATVQEDGEEIQIGMGRFEPIADDDVREMAVDVGDNWRKEGVGKLLTVKLIDFAKKQGIKQLVSVALSENFAMRELADDLGMTSCHNDKNVHRVIYSLKL